MKTVYDFPQYDHMTKGERDAFGQVLQRHQTATELGETFGGINVDKRKLVAYDSLEAKGLVHIDRTDWLVFLGANALAIVNDDEEQDWDAAAESITREIMAIADEEDAEYAAGHIEELAADLEDDARGMPDFSDADEYEADDPAMVRPADEIEDPLDREYGIYAPKVADDALLMIDAIKEFFEGPVLIDGTSTSEIRESLVAEPKAKRTLAPYAAPKMATRRVIDTETTFSGVFALIEDGDEDYAFGHTLTGFINDSTYERQIELTGENVLFFSGEAKVFQLADDVEAITSSGRTNVKATIWRTLASFTQLTVSELTEAVNVIATHHTGKALDEKYVHAYLKELSESGLATCRSDKGTKIGRQVWAAIEKSE